MDKLIYTLTDETYSFIWLPREESLNKSLSAMSAMLPAGGPRFASGSVRLFGEEFIVRWNQVGSPTRWAHRSLQTQAPGRTESRPAFPRTTLGSSHGRVT